MLQIPLQMTQKEKSGLRILKEAVHSVALLFVRLFFVYFVNLLVHLTFHLFVRLFLFFFAIGS